MYYKRASYLHLMDVSGRCMPIVTIDHFEDRTFKREIVQDDFKQHRGASAAEQQGVAGFVSWLKTIRLEKLLHEMEQIDFRRSNALNELKALVKSVEELIASNRGGEKGIHGFIGERAQVYIKNAKALLNGSDRISKLIDDNGMIDYWENGIAVQQKACRDKLGLPHLLDHKAKYPEYSGIGQIPKDFYETYKRLEKLTEAEAGRLTKPDRKIWLEIQKIKKAGIIVKPMECTYDEIQKNTIYDTIDKQEREIKAEATRQEAQAIARHRPTLREGVMVTATSAAVEGVMSGAEEILNKRHEGKRIRDFDLDDAKDIGKAALKGSGKGAVRGAVVYTATNFTQIPAPVAGAAVTVAFDSVSAVKKYTDGKITGAECAEEIGKSALIASAGALGAKIGGKLCPVPVVGEVVGGFIFSFAADKGYVWLRRRLVASQPDLLLASA